MKLTSYARTAAPAPIARSRDGLVPPTEWPCTYAEAAVQPVQQLRVPDAAQQPDAVPSVGHALGVPLPVRRRTDDDERQPARRAHVALDDHVDVVLGLEPGDDEVVPSGSSPSSAIRPSASGPGFLVP